MSRTSNAARARPLSPHLSIWKWGPHMAVSIAHRVCGVVMATVGTGVFLWWLAALAAGPASYAMFHDWIVRAPDGALSITVLLARIVAIGLTLTLFTHMGNGVRHLVMDLGAGFELRRNKASALAVFAFGVVATALIWALILTKGA